MKYSLKKVDDTEYGYIDQDGCSWTSPYDWLWSGILGGCGCGSSEEFGELTFKVLEYFSTEIMKRTRYIYDTPIEEVIAHWLTTKDLIEHGTSIGGSWLTDEGDNVYKLLSGLQPKRK